MFAPHPPAPAPEWTREAMAGAVEARADRMTTDGYDGDPAVRVRLVPQIPLRDAIQTHSRLGGRPHLPAATDWPRIDGVKGDFLAQIACADLPQGLRSEEPRLNSSH